MMTKLCLAGGLLLLVLPVLTGIYHVWIESWSLLDWIVLYSFVYWPTYIIGFVLITFYFMQNRRNTHETSSKR